MCPERAALGTVNNRPARVLRRCEIGERRTIRPPGVRGNAIVDPAASPLPPICSVPRVETWWGSPLHLALGTQLTLVMRTLSTCGLDVARPLLAGAVATGPAPPLTPPCEAAPAPSASELGAPADSAINAKSSAKAILAARGECRAPDRLWTATGAKTILSTASRTSTPIGRRQRLAALSWRTGLRHRSCVLDPKATRSDIWAERLCTPAYAPCRGRSLSPSESRPRTGSARAGSRAGRAACRAG